MSYTDDERAPLPRGARLGVDVGSVRVGLATSDPDGLIATPVETLARDTTTKAPSADGVGPVPNDVARIASEVGERGVQIVYIGLPRHLSGAEGTATGLARAYAGQVARAVAPVPVHLVDERMTTVSAHQAMRAAGRAGRKQRSVVDQVAAVIILQTALDSERATGGRAGEVVDQ